jgi:hypothetical protein
VIGEHGVLGERQTGSNQKPERYNFQFGSQDFIQLISASEVISLL